MTTRNKSIVKKLSTITKANSNSKLSHFKCALSSKTYQVIIGYHRCINDTSTEYYFSIEETTLQVWVEYNLGIIKILLDNTTNNSIIKQR